MAGGTSAAMGRGQGTESAPASAAQRARPFCQAAQFGCEQGNAFTGTQGVNPLTYGPNPLPATGYIRRVRLPAVLTGGAAGTFTAGGDAPWNFYNLIRFAEPNAAPVFELTGFNTLVADYFGGFAGWDDPRQDWDYVGTSPNINIEPYVPVELDPTGMGALSNLRNASAFRLTLIVEAAANIYSVNPTTFSAFTVVPHVDYWTLPNQVDQENNPQATAPPYPGTIQLWSQIQNLTARPSATTGRASTGWGTSSGPWRWSPASAGLRSETPFPNPAQLRWDDINLRIETPQSIRKIMRETVFGTSTRDVGVYVYPYSTGVTRGVGGNGV